MSIKLKVLLVFMTCVTLILAVSNTLEYRIARNLLLQSMETHIVKSTEQFNETMKSVAKRSTYSEYLLAENLRIDSIYAEHALSPDAANVTNQQLVDLSTKLGISDITLMQIDPSGKYFVGVKSSDPKEIGIKTDSWDYWNDAFLQLYHDHKVTVKQGEKMDNYWAGPIGIASSNTTKVDKWGYYYDGKTNYIIDPYIQDGDIIKFQQTLGPDSILENQFPALEVAGFNPNAFGKPPILTKADNGGGTFVRLENRPVLFGKYTFKDPKDVSAVDQADKTGQHVFFVTTDNGKKIVKTFVPVQDPSIGQPYVIEVVGDYTPIQQKLTHYLKYSIFVSALILVLLAIFSYLFAHYISKPITKISDAVKRLAKMDFDQFPVSIQHRDEFGKLLDNINIMSRSLQAYTAGLKSSIFQERSDTMFFLGMVLKGLVHELKNPITAMQSFTQVLPTLLQNQENEKAIQTVNHLKTVSQGMLGLVEEVSTLIRQGRVELKVHDIRSTVAEVVEYVRPMASEIDCTIDLAPSDSFLAVYDPQKVKQVLIRLLQSGVDAMTTLPRKVIVVSLYLRGQEVIIDLSRTGEIPIERRHKIFTRIYKTKGDPLGLRFIICDYILRSNGGSISVVDKPEFDTTMLISLPKHVPVPEPDSKKTIETSEYIPVQHSI